jgi:hypothetical protein
MKNQESIDTSSNTKVTLFERFVSLYANTFNAAMSIK